MSEVEREKNRVIEEKERQLGRVNQQLEECEQVIAQFQRRITELEQLRPATDATPRSKQQSSSSRARIKMTWREGRKAPCKMSTYYNAVADGTAMYVRLENNSLCFHHKHLLLVSTSRQPKLRMPLSHRQQPPHSRWW